MTNAREVQKVNDKQEKKRKLQVAAKKEKEKRNRNKKKVKQQRCCYVIVRGDAHETAGARE